MHVHGVNIFSNMKGFNHYQDTASQWRWRLKDGNHEIVADSGQGFPQKSESEKEAELFKTLGPSAPVRNAEKDKARHKDPEWEYYLDKAGEWRWRFLIGSGTQIIADSSEGYESEHNVKRAIANVKDLLKDLAKDSGGYNSPGSGGSTGSGRFA